MSDAALTRRDVLRGLGLVAGSTLVEPGWLRTAAAGPGAAPGVGKGAKRAWYELGLMADPIMESQLLHYLSTTYQQFADIGEVLDTATRIEADDPMSWPREWLKTAERVGKIAEASLAKGRKASAGEAYLRASNYRRAALIHHPNPKDPGVPRAALKSVEEFDRGIALLGVPAQPVRIPYERTTLRGIFYRSPAARGNAPLLIVFQGRDAWVEEMKYLADAGMRRGYHCLQFHGPGQSLPLRVQGLPFRPDWEKVVTPVVDYAVKLAGVDPKRLALMGLSFGGALAPRAAAFEHRLKVLVANPGVLNWDAAIRFTLTGLAPELMKVLEANPRAFNPAVEEAMRRSPLLAWGFKDMMWKHGARTPLELMEKLKAFNNEPVVGRIRARTLVMDAEAEAFSPGQQRKFYDALKAPKDYMLFTAEDTGLLHCQEGASAVMSQRLFDWLDEHL